MRTLVTGCAGFVGSHLCESLLQDGHEVIGIDCFNDNYARRTKLRNLEIARAWDAFEFVPIDLSRGELHELAAGCEAVFHLAAEPGVRSSWGARFAAYTRNNIAATQHLLDAVKEAPATRFVYASSSSIYGQAESRPTREDVVPQPYSPYGVTKLAAEHLCSLYHGNYGVDAVSLRFFTVYGPRQRPDMAFSSFCRSIRTGTPITVFSDGRQTRDFTYVSDIVDGIRAAAATPGIGGAVFNLGGGSEVSIADVLGLLSDFAGRRLDVTYADAQRGDVRSTSADCERARSAIGYAPSVSVPEGLRRQFDWFLEHGEGVL
jgi:UDP-glucose 4-epimerase